MVSNIIMSYIFLSLLYVYKNFCEYALILIIRAIQNFPLIVIDCSLRRRTTSKYASQRQQHVTRRLSFVSQFLSLGGNNALFCVRILLVFRRKSMDVLLIIFIIYFYWHQVFRFILHMERWQRNRVVDLTCQLSGPPFESRRRHLQISY